MADLLRRQVALIVGNTPAALAAKAATTTVPIVFVAGVDPVRVGLVASLNRPGGNVTGSASSRWNLGPSSLGSCVSCCREPRALPCSSIPNIPSQNALSQSCGLRLWPLGSNSIVLDVSSDREIETAFTTLVQRGAGALVGGTGGLLLTQRERVVALAARHRIPAIYFFREYVAGRRPDELRAQHSDAYRQAGIYAGRILKGEKPADLPVMQPTKFDFVINLKTAKALGLEIPDTLLARPTR